MKNADPLDALDELTRPDPKPLPPDHTRFMAVTPRAQSSQEIEERERQWLQSTRLGCGPSWVIPFHNDDGSIMPLTPDQIASLEHTYQITLAEYLELMKWEPRQ